MRNARSNINLLIFIFSVVFVTGGLFWANLNFTQQYSGGADFIVPWKAMNNFIFEGESPYGEITRQNINTLIYQRQLPVGQYLYRVNIPLLMLLLYLPLAWISDLALARAIWMVVLELSLFFVVLLSLRLSRWKAHWLIILLLLLFAVFWQPSVSVLLAATSIMVQAGLFVSAFRCLELDADELAGALAALTLFNVEATGFVFLTLLVWVFSTQRWRVLNGILMTLTLLLILSLMFFQGWILPFITATITNWQSGTIPSTYSIFIDWLPGIGRRLGQLFSIGALSILLVEWRAVREQDVRWLFWTSCIGAAVTPLLGLPYFPHWLAFTLPGVLLVISVMVDRWNLLGYISAVILLAGIFAGLWAAQIYEFTSVFLLVYPLVLTLLLYWVRWGAVRRPRLWVDELMSRG